MSDFELKHGVTWFIYTPEMEQVSTKRRTCEKNSERFGHHDLSWLLFCRSHTVDGTENFHQLRLVVYPSIKGFYTSQVVQDFFHQQYKEVVYLQVLSSIRVSDSLGPRIVAPEHVQTILVLERYYASLKMEGRPFKTEPIIKPSKE